MRVCDRNAASYIAVPVLLGIIAQILHVEVSAWLAQLMHRKTNCAEDRI